MVIERKHSPDASIERYYQYQTLYLRLMAKNQMAEDTVPRGEYADVRRQSGDCRDEIVLAEKTPENGFNETSLGFAGNQASTIVGDSSSYACSRCGNAYTRLHSLNRHIRFECGVEPRFECPVCHKKSKHKHNLLLHMRIHAHRKP
ncbi:unnamed protein product [Xylocopa violacea]|uniref:C2H2-type domain-containing protein n=1 Tax=Xylocopa violacea TaxID=135666 RepID=A0ABP1NFT6_XYLVO